MLVWLVASFQVCKEKGRQEIGFIKFVTLDWVCYENKKAIIILCIITLISSFSLWFNFGNKLLQVGNKLFIVVLITCVLAGVASITMLLLLLLKK